MLSYSTDQTVGPCLKIKVNSSHFLLSGTCLDRSDPSKKPSLTPTTFQSEETRTTGRANTITSWPGHWWHPLLFRGEEVCALTYLRCKTSCSSGGEWRCDELLMSHLIPVCAARDWLAHDGTKVRLQWLTFPDLTLICQTRAIYVLKETSRSYTTLMEGYAVFCTQQNNFLRCVMTTCVGLAYFLPWNLFSFCNSIYWLILCF